MTKCTSKRLEVEGPGKKRIEEKKRQQKGDRGRQEDDLPVRSEKKRKEKAFFQERNSDEEEGQREERIVRKRKSYSWRTMGREQVARKRLSSPKRSKQLQTLKLDPSSGEENRGISHRKKDAKRFHWPAKKLLTSTGVFSEGDLARKLAEAVDVSKKLGMTEGMILAWAVRDGRGFEAHELGGIPGGGCA